MALENHRTARKGGDPRNTTGAPTFTEALEAVIPIEHENSRNRVSTAVDTR